MHSIIIVGTTGFLAPDNVYLAVKIKTLGNLDVEILRDTHL